MKIYVVCSVDNDECSLNNRAFTEHLVAWNYLQEVEENSGCDMKMLHMELENDIRSETNK